MHPAIPKNWKREYVGVMTRYSSPNGREYIQENYLGEYDWHYHGKTGRGEYISDCITQMAMLGFLEGEFE